MAELPRPLRLMPLTRYLCERQRKEVYAEDCMWLVAIPNLQEKHRSSLVQPYAQQERRVFSEAQQITPNTPIRTKEQMASFIFEGI